MCGHWPSGPGNPVRARMVIIGCVSMATTHITGLRLFPLLPGIQEASRDLALQKLVELGRLNPRLLLGGEPFEKPLGGNAVKHSWPCNRLGWIRNQERVPKLCTMAFQGRRSGTFDGLGRPSYVGNRPIAACRGTL